MFDRFHRLPLGVWTRRLPVAGAAGGAPGPAPAVRLVGLSHGVEPAGSVWDGRGRGNGTVRFKLALRGVAETWVGRRRFVHAAGRAMLLLPREATRVRVPPDGEPWEFVWVKCEGAEAVRIARGLRARIGPMFELDDRAESLEDLAEVVRRAANGGFASVYDESLGVYRLLMHLCQDLCGTPREAVWRRCEAARRLAESDGAGPIGVAELARAAGMSESHLHRCFRRYYGTSPHRLILAARLARARELLRSTPLSVKEIAVRSGFPDAPSFGRAFRADAGVAPGAWRGCPGHDGSRV